MILIWWSIGGSNPWPLQCHCSALPAAPMPQVLFLWCSLRTCLSILHSPRSNKDDYIAFRLYLCKSHFFHSHGFGMGGCSQRGERVARRIGATAAWIARNTSGASRANGALRLPGRPFHARFLRKGPRAGAPKGFLTLSMKARGFAPIS